MEMADVTSISKISGRERLLGVGHVDEMVADLGPLIRRRLGGTYIQSTVDLHRVGIDDLGINCMCQPQGQITFA